MGISKRTSDEILIHSLSIEIGLQEVNEGDLPTYQSQITHYFLL